MSLTSWTRRSTHTAPVMAAVSTRPTANKYFHVNMRTSDIELGTISILTSPVFSKRIIHNPNATVTTQKHPCLPGPEGLERIKHKNQLKHSGLQSIFEVRSNSSRTCLTHSRFDNLKNTKINQFHEPTRRSNAVFWALTLPGVSYRRERSTGYDVVVISAPQILLCFSCADKCGGSRPLASWISLHLIYCTDRIAWHLFCTSTLWFVE